MTPYNSAILDHYRKTWGPLVREIDPSGGRRAELPSDFRVLEFQRSSTTRVLATLGMSQPPDTTRIELHVHVANESSQAADAAVRLLSVVAHYHRTGTALDLGHTVNLGEPWMRGSLCTFGLVSLPYLDGPGLEWLEEYTVRCLWLLPITEAEREFKKSHGLEALEEIFDAHHVEYSNPWRASLVSDRVDKVH